MKPSVIAGVLVLAVCVAAPSAQTKCDVQGPPFGPTGFTGEAGHVFDYWSHRGSMNGENFYQPGVKNLGTTPLTVDWPAADYFRRGIPSGKEVPGTCRSDRNDLNTAAGPMRYGPNLNYQGPSAAPFFTKSGAQAARASGGIKFFVEWEAILESGEKYAAAFSVDAFASSPNEVRYGFGNKGQAVEIEWPGVLTLTTLEAVRRQSAFLVRGTRLFLPAFEPIQFTITGDGQSAAAVASPLSIFVPNGGPLLYRDSHRGIALVALNLIQ